MLVKATTLHSSVAKDENTYVMVTELPDTIEIRHTNVTRSFVRYKFVTCLLACLLTYFDMYDHLSYAKTTVFSDRSITYRPIIL